ncbi:hypothetical protein LUZ63_017200 [Rhynchospora breviuscula]|uniref:Uncharacterized protein n=1 Tax=Rhynchospora breviuscula TaxID=2022672 RepID=A0A9Q0C207_9POAL|nr:hypothetical protein LUZ63_017200 [Rhynchospora breviuscula]
MRLEESSPGGDALPVILAISALRSQPVWGFASPNSTTANGVLEFSIAYFTIFLIHDLFIAHHLATLFVFCQSIWTLAGLRKDDSEMARRFYWVLYPPFYALYTVMRVVAGPLFFDECFSYKTRGKGRDAKFAYLFPGLWLSERPLW